MELQGTASIRRHSLVLMSVLGVHVLIGLGVIAATAMHRTVLIPAHLTGVEARREELPPPDDRPPPDLPQRPFVAQVTPTDVPPVTVATHGTALAIEQPESTASGAVEREAPAVTAARVARGVDLGTACQAYYPSASRRLAEEGSAVVLVYVAASGRVTDSRIETSSGYPRLDAATLACVSREGRFEPKREDGNAVGSWLRMRYTWRMRS